MDTITTGYAQSATLTEPSSSLLYSINSRLEIVASRLIDANTDLSMLRDRVFGPSPATAQSLGKAGPSAPPTMAESVHNWLDTISGHLDATADLARGLYARI